MSKLSPAQDRLLGYMRSMGTGGTHMMARVDLTGPQRQTAASLDRAGILTGSENFVWFVQDDGSHSVGDTDVASPTPATLVLSVSSAGRKADQPNGGEMPALTVECEYPNGCDAASITLPLHHAARAAKRKARHDRPCRATDRRTASAARDDVRFGMR